MRLPLLLALAVALALATPASAAKITVDKAGITKGRLVVTGRSAAGTTVSIDGTGYKRRVRSDGTFSFAFSTWRPDTCKLTLRNGGTARGVVLANCGPRGPAGAPGLTAEGAWSAIEPYPAGAVVSVDGASFVALVPVAAGVEPGTPAAAGVWSVLAKASPAPAPPKPLLAGYGLVGGGSDVPANTGDFVVVGTASTKITRVFQGGESIHLQYTVHLKAPNGTTGEVLFGLCRITNGAPIVFTYASASLQGGETATVSGFEQVTAAGSRTYALCISSTAAVALDVAQIAGSALVYGP